MFRPTFEVRVSCTQQGKLPIFIIDWGKPSKIAGTPFGQISVSDSKQGFPD